jgi:hypothetical protein
VYLQQRLTDAVDATILADFVKFGWDKLAVIQVRGLFKGYLKEE